MLQKQKGEMEMAKQAATEVIKGKFSGSGDLKGWRFNNHHRSKLAKARNRNNKEKIHLLIHLKFPELFAHENEDYLNNLSVSN